MIKKLKQLVKTIFETFLENLNFEKFSRVMKFTYRFHKNLNFGMQFEEK